MSCLPLRCLTCSWKHRWWGFSTPLWRTFNIACIFLNGQPITSVCQQRKKYSFSLCSSLIYIFEACHLKTHLFFPSSDWAVPKYSTSFQTMQQVGSEPGEQLRGGLSLPVADALHPACALCCPRAGVVRGGHAQCCTGQEPFCPPQFLHTAQGTCTGRWVVAALLLSNRKSSLANLVTAIQDDAALWFPMAFCHMEEKGKSNVLLPLFRKRMWWLAWQAPGKSHDSTWSPGEGLQQTLLFTCC